MTVEACVTIHRTPEDVFAFVADPANQPSWDLDVSHANAATTGPTRRTSVFRWTVSSSLTVGKVETVVRVSGFQPGRLLELHADGGGVRQAITLEVNPDEDTADATRCTRSVAVEAGVSPSRERLLRPRLYARNRRSLERLKAVLEGRAVADSHPRSSTAAGSPAPPR